MNIKILNRDEIDTKKWDKCIDEAQNGLVYGYSWYLDIVSPNWKAIVANNYEYILPLTWKQKYGLKYIYKPTHIQKLNIFSKKTVKDFIYYKFFSKIPMSFIFVEIMIDANLCLKTSKYNFSKRDTYELNLNKSAKELVKSFTKSHLKNIKKAKKRNIEIVISKNILDVIEVKKEVIKRNNLNNSNHILTLTKILKYSQERTLKPMVYSAYENDKLEASAYFMPFRDVYLIYSGTTDSARKTGAMFLIIEQFILENSGNERILDFVGSDIDGVAKRNAGFGSKKRQYTYVKRNSLVNKIKDKLIDNK